MISSSVESAPLLGLLHHDFDHKALVKSVDVESAPLLDLLDHDFDHKALVKCVEARIIIVSSMLPVPKRLSWLQLFLAFCWLF